MTILGSHSIDFNLLPVSAHRQLTPRDIEKNYAFLKFASTLQYVALPNLLPNAAPLAKAGEDKAEGTGGSKPDHYKEIFGWLRQNGNVKEVLRIIVEDDLQHPHDDEIIEETVKNLGVEMWDWRKYDISSETIRVAAPEVRELHLYTTGNDAVLWGWSDQDGLRNLKNVGQLSHSVNFR